MKQLDQKYKNNLGIFGENLASSYLQEKGYTIIERNFKARYGEIDIIAKIHDLIVFVEVKTRTGNQFGLPEEAVTKRKIHEVVQTAQYYCLLHKDTPKAQRIDVIAILLSRDRSVMDIKHIENITL
jgi:putative endonuclease